MTGPAPYHRDAVVTVYHGDCPGILNLTEREQGRPAIMLGRLVGGDAGGALSVHYWRMSTHTTPDSRRRKPRPNSETGRAGR